MRRQRHRLKDTRPRELAPPGSDPLLLASECLEHLKLVRTALGAHPRAHGHLDEVCESSRGNTYRVPSRTGENWALSSPVDWASWRAIGFDTTGDIIVP